MLDVRGSFDYPLEIVKNNNINSKFARSFKEVNFKPLIIICSTSEVYGNVKKIQMPITEKQKIAPINPYAVTKTFQDLLSQVYSKVYKFNIIITRMFSYTTKEDKTYFKQHLQNKYKDEKYNKRYILW